MLGGDSLIVDVVAHGRHEAHLVAHGAEHVVEERGDGGLAIGAGNTDEPHLFGGIIIECCGDGAYGLLTVGYAHIGDALGKRFGQLLAHDGSGSPLDGTWDVLVSVDLRAAHGYEEVVLGYAPRVDVHIGDVALRIAHDLFNAYSFDNV